jgi:hypothetical protein
VDARPTSRVEADDLPIKHCVRTSFSVINKARFENRASALASRERNSGCTTPMESSTRNPSYFSSKTSLRVVERL